MEPILRKIVELVIRGLAYIPMGAASIAFITSAVILVRRVFVWVKTGVWNLPALHETVDLGFLHLLLDERLSGFRRSLIEAAATVATLPSPVIFGVCGALFLATGLAMLHFAGAIKEAAG